MSKNRGRRKVDKSVKKPQDVLLVLLEGPTEEVYVKYLKQIYEAKFQVRTFKKSKLNSNIKKDIDNLALNESIDAKEVILLYDLENSEEEFNKFIKNDKLVHQNTYLVQPCIEVHFLMHHGIVVPSNKLISAKEALVKLKRELPNYKKGEFSWEHNVVDHDMIEVAKEASIQSFKNYKQYSFSMLGMFIETHLLKK